MAFNDIYSDVYYVGLPLSCRKFDIKDTVTTQLRFRTQLEKPFLMASTNERNGIQKGSGDFRQQSYTAIDTTKKSLYGIFMKYA